MRNLGGKARTVQQLQRHRAVHILPPVFPICGNRNLPVGPLTGQMDTHTGNNCGPVLQAEGGEVQTAEDIQKQRGGKKDFKGFS